MSTTAPDERMISQADPGWSPVAAVSPDPRSVRGEIRTRDRPVTNPAGITFPEIPSRSASAAATSPLVVDEILP